MKKIKLTFGQSALVDNEDFDWLNQWRWYCNAQGYAVRKPYVRGSGKKNQKGLSIRMHILVNKTPEGMETDHVNRDRLDNRKCNLRSVTSSQNKFNTKIRIDNTSGHKGVVWDKENAKWRVTLTANGKTINMGRFNLIKDAITARIKAERIYHEIA